MRRAGHALPRAGEPVRGRLHRVAGDELGDLGEERPLRLGGSELALDSAAEGAVANGTGNITLGFRPETVRLGDGPLQAQIRTVEDLGNEVFVHIALDHRGDSLGLVSRLAPPFDASPGDNIGVQLAGTTHLFGGDGMRLTSTKATLG